MKQCSLIFAYNADSGLWNYLADGLHRVISPATYPCNLCALTYSNTGRMRAEWKTFLAGVDTPVRFLHRDELVREIGLQEFPLPLLLRQCETSLQVLAGAAEMNRCRSLPELIALISASLQPGEGASHSHTAAAQ